MRAAKIAQASATEPCDSERSISQSSVSRIDLRDAATAWAVDFDAKPKHGYLAKCREGQWVKHPPTIDHRCRASLPAVLIPAVQSPPPVVACPCLFGMSGLRLMGASIPKDQPPGVLSGDYVDLTAEEFQEAYATLLNVDAGLLPCAPDFPTEIFKATSPRPPPFPDTPFNRAWYTAGTLFDDDSKRVSFYWRVNKVMPLTKDRK